MEERTRATSETHPHHIKLSNMDRYHLSILAHMGLWARTALAMLYKVDRKTVANTMKRYPMNKGDLLANYDPDRVRGPRCMVCGAEMQEAGGDYVCPSCGASSGTAERTRSD